MLTIDLQWSDTLINQKVSTLKKANTNTHENYRRIRTFFSISQEKGSKTFPTELNAERRRGLYHF